MGRPTERLERMVESIEIRPSLSASAILVSTVIERSRIGFPYLCSPIWIRGVGRRLDQVAGRVDHEEAELAALDLAAEEDGDVEGAGLALLLRQPADAMDLADGAADQPGGAEHRVDAHQSLDLAGLGIAEALGDH